VCAFLTEEDAALLFTPFRDSRMIDALCIRIDAFAHVADKVGVVLGMLAIALALVPCACDAWRALGRRRRKDA
jgi:hypothetical protein